MPNFGTKDPRIQRVLRTQMHKVAAIVAQQDGLLPSGVDELDLKTAAYLIGYQAFKHKLEKKAMFEGILSISELQGQ